MKKFSQLITEGGYTHKFWYIPQTNKLDTWNNSSIHHVHKIAKESIYEPYRTESGMKSYRDRGGDNKTYIPALIAGALGFNLVRGTAIATRDNYHFILTIGRGFERSQRKFCKKLIEVYGRDKISGVSVESMSIDFPYNLNLIANTSDPLEINRILKSGNFK